MANVELPFRAEYAKSGRAACKSCKQKIEKDYLRLAAMVQSPMFDSKVPNWYHFSCFFIKQRPKSVGDISHFESLRWEDQEKIRKKVDNCAGESSSLMKSTSSKTTKRKSTKSDTNGEFKVEYSKSSRATCRGCEDKIIKGDVRVSKKDYDSDEGRRYGGIDLWHHLECFAKVRHELEFWMSGAQLSGIKTLDKEDQIKVKKVLPELKPIKKEEPEEESVKKPKLENDSIVKKQNQDMYRYRDLLKTLPKKHLSELLTTNEQEVPVGLESILDRLSDVMTFGALKRCPFCKKGQLVFRSGVGYFCLGNVDEWTACESAFDEPDRKPFVVPKELKEQYEFLKKYKYKPVKRVFQKNVPSASTVAKSNFPPLKSEPGKSGLKVERYLPLRRMEFCIAGKLSKDKKDLKLEIMKLGGTLGSSIYDMTTAVISTPEIVKKKGSVMKTAEDLNIQVVPESFLDECKSGGDPIAIINRMNLVTWGSDPSTRLSADVPTFKSTSNSSRYKSVATKVKLKIHGGIAVDPESNLESETHVYRDPKGNIYNASLSLTDLQTRKNSYYKIQVLEPNSDSNKKSYRIFRSWGRIGTTIGGHKVEKKSREEAVDEFKQLFLERTGNSWDARKNFMKIPGKMVMVDVSYDDDEVDGKICDVPSKLENSIQDLVKLILNVKLMKSVMKEMELDLEKMPLGKLSKKQIQDAFKVLTKIQDSINKEGSEIDQRIVISCTNQFFSLIPHSFGIDSPPLLNNLEIIKQKTEMLDSLLEIEIAYSLLRNPEEADGAISQIDSHYRKLKAELRTLNKGDQEFETLQLYVKNTHAETHKNYELEVVEIFKVDRHGEHERYSSFKNLHNKKLLWHGSRLTNFAGILSQGLRIAPPEAPVTGYMFGKGIYFADMVSKSANYCMAHPGNNVGLLLLCEVALGDMHELYEAKNIVKPPKGKHSVKGIGKTHPDPKMTKFTEDGVEIPLGPGVPSTQNATSLLYNEYIVYNAAQVKVKYLVQVKFSFAY